jgi:hypothetical protein
MILYLALQLIPIGYGTLYFYHSMKKKRTGQAIAILFLMLPVLFAAGILLWEFLKLP